MSNINGSLPTAATGGERAWWAAAAAAAVSAQVRGGGAAVSAQVGRRGWRWRGGRTRASRGTQVVVVVSASVAGAGEVSGGGGERRAEVNVPGELPRDVSGGGGGGGDRRGGRRRTSRAMRCGIGCWVVFGWNVAAYQSSEFNTGVAECGTSIVFKGVVDKFKFEYAGSPGNVGEYGELLPSLRNKAGAPVCLRQ
ncbi:hypothetical protein C8J57DRAFT_1254364 [Mycena rebaudengoi]|nr:hypothetical protein C8J57DRAFT_1254364 [Mycena rebaudengoi]